MPGLMVFRSLTEALSQGYQVFDKTPEGYLVRRKMTTGWALAIVDCTPGGATRL